MTPAGRRFLGLLVAITFAVVACLMFPRVMAFAELAARELRYFWWLVLILAFGVWLALFGGRRGRE